MKNNIIYLILLLLFSSVHCSNKLYHVKTKGYYKIENNLSTNRNNDPDSSIIVGKVLDNKSKSPIPYGWVRTDGTKIGVSADSLGNYLFKVVPGKCKLSAGSGSHITLTTKNIKFERKQIIHIDFYLGSYSIY